MQVFFPISLYVIQEKLRNWYPYVNTTGESGVVWGVVRKYLLTSVPSPEQIDRFLRYTHVLFQTAHKLYMLVVFRHTFIAMSVI